MALGAVSGSSPSSRATATPRSRRTSRRARTAASCSIDPPYESDLEFDRVLAGLELAHERWPTGTFCVWYPLTDRAGPVRFHRGLERSGIRRVLDVSLRVLPPDARVGMSGAGLTIVNPPWQLDDGLRELLPELHRLLSPDGLGGSGVEWIVPE